MVCKMLLFVWLCVQVLIGTQNVVQSELIPAEESIAVTISSGKLRGRLGLSRSNRTFYSFRGIPYAKPPVDELRFKAPVPPEPWNDVLDAYQDGPMCIQKNYLFEQNPPVEGHEDCLYLNVYTPKIFSTKSPRPSKLLPVMVFIHYGAFFAGSGNSDFLGPEYFMDEDVILVTFNYRLGVFGFLSTNDDAAPGNWALKDQVEVLRWVQENIHAFMGDNKRVTIFGQSAGAGSVHYHLLSPQTENLFHGAITQSGSALALWAKPLGPIQALVAQQQALVVGCNNINNTYIMIDCLRKVDASTLAESVSMFKYFSNEPFIIYGPVAEKKTEWNPNPYITEEPLTLINDGKFHDVPWIIGVVSHEGILKAASLVRQEKTLKEFNENLDEYAPKMLALDFSVAPSDVPKLWENISNYFLNGNEISASDPDSIHGLINLYSDRSFFHSSYQSALLHSKKGHNPIWFYHFGYKGNYTYGDHFAATDETVPFDWGVSHCDDLLYLFTSPKFFPPLVTKNDILMSKIMIKLWTNFAKFRNPTPTTDLTMQRWLPIKNIEGEETAKNEHLCYLNITGSYKSDKDKPRLELSNKFYPDRINYWHSLPLAENIVGIE